MAEELDIEAVTRAGDNSKATAIFTSANELVLLKVDAKAEKSVAAQGGGRTLDETYSQHVGRTKSDTKPASGEMPTKLPRKMKNSASVKSAFRHFEEDDIVEARRPATVREGRDRATAAAEEEDDEVDARADDFINRFKQQLKLQKLDSIIRYKETVNRGR